MCAIKRIKSNQTIPEIQQTQKPSDTMRKIKDCFNKQLATIYQQILQLDELTKLIDQFLPSSLKGHCEVTQFNQGRMNIGINEVALATELRFFLPTLRDLLRQKAGLYQLVSINISINPQMQQSKPLVKSHLGLSGAAQIAIAEASKLSEFEPLRKAWKHLLTAPKS